MSINKISQSTYQTSNFSKNSTGISKPEIETKRANNEQINIQNREQNKDLTTSSDEKNVETTLEIKDLEKAIGSINDFIKTTDTSLHFKLHDELGDYYAQIVDFETEEVIKEIPSEKMMDLYASILQSIGILVDKKI